MKPWPPGMSRDRPKPLGPLEAAILSTFSAGRIYTKNDVVHRLRDRGVKAAPEEVVRALKRVASKGWLIAERYSSCSLKATTYRMKEGRT